MTTTVNEILSYPKRVLNKINKLIITGENSETIRTYLAGNCSEVLNNNIPDISVIQNYIELQAASNSNNNAIVVAGEAIEDYSEKKVDIEVLKSKKETLENLVELCHSRLRRIDEATKNKVDPRLESHMRSYIEEARHLIETLAKLSGELGDEQNVVVNVVQMELVKFFRVIQEIVLELCPDKLPQFKEKLKEKFKEIQTEEKIEKVDWQEQATGGTVNQEGKNE
jgi:hypothetical protein